MVQAPPPKAAANVYDRKALESVSRQRLQQIAKKEGIKASAKSAEIIQQLFKKYPSGVPRPDKPVRTIKKPEPYQFQYKATEYNGSSIWSSSSDESTFESRLYRMDSSAMQHSREARWRASHWAREVADSGEPEDVVISRSPSPPATPGPKDVRHVRREITKLINEMPSIQADIDSARTLIETTADKLRESIGTLRELVSTRNAIESSIVKRMKDDRRLWDGTYHFLNDDDVRAWSEFLADAKEAARKEEEEEKKRDEIKLAEARKQQERLDDIERKRSVKRAERRARHIQEDIMLGLRPAPIPVAPPIPVPESKNQPQTKAQPQASRSNKRKLGH